MELRIKRCICLLMHETPGFLRACSMTPQEPLYEQRLMAAPPLAIAREHEPVTPGSPSSAHAIHANPMRRGDRGAPKWPIPGRWGGVSGQIRPCKHFCLVSASAERPRPGPASPRPAGRTRWGPTMAQRLKSARRTRRSQGCGGTPTKKMVRASAFAPHLRTPRLCQMALDGDPTGHDTRPSLGSHPPQLRNSGDCHRGACIPAARPRAWRGQEVGNKPAGARTRALPFAQRRKVCKRRLP